MHRDVIADAGLGNLAQISLVLFLLAFALIMFRAFFMNQDKAKHIKDLPLEDGQLDHDNEGDNAFDDDRVAVEGSKS